MPRLSPENRQANIILVDVLKEIADRKGITPAQLALAWLLAQKPWIVPIPGTSKLSRVRENLGGAQVKLDAADLQEIEAKVSGMELRGARLPEVALKMTVL